MYYFLLNEQCIDLFKKVTFFYNMNYYETNITKVISIFILNMLVFKQKEMENENNIINCDSNDDYLIDYLNDFIDLIISMDIADEIYISLLIYYNRKKIIKII